MKHRQKVTEIMTREPVTVHTNHRLSDVRAALQEHRIHHIPVVAGTRFIGLISSTDLMRVSFGDTYSQDVHTIDALLDTMTIREVMAEDVLTVGPETTVREAAEKLATGSFHCLPVIGEDGTLLGVLTSTDLIKFLLEAY